MEYLIACTHKAPQEGVLRKPDMNPFDNICDNIMNHLMGKHARGEDLDALAKQLVIREAIRLAFVDDVK